MIFIKNSKNKNPRLSGESRGYASQQAWQGGEVQERGVPLLVGVELNFVWVVKVEFKSFLISIGQVAVNVDRFTIGAGTIKCIRVYV